VTAVKASSLDPAGFGRQFAEAARLQGFRAEPLGEAGGAPLVAYTKRTPGPRPRLYISSGIHGDEPAPPLALLRMLEAGLFDDRATWFLCPLLNPSGFLNGTRENAGGIDLNRDYKSLRAEEIAAHVRWLERQPRFDTAFCLHEDWEATGFYLYELNAATLPSLAETVLTAVRVHGPIETAVLIDGREISAPGIIRPAGDPRLRESWPEAVYLCVHHTHRCYTLETASSLPLEQRILKQMAAMQAALAAVFTDSR
jgi:predicted deacylase